MIEKCRYFNDHRTACSLMLDDLSNTATTTDGKLHPWNDWGYGQRESGSLYGYLDDTLFAKYPEIRGTIFLPIGRHATQNENSGYKILTGDLGGDFADFVASIAGRFDIAFHGTTHGRYKDRDNPELPGNWEQEFEYITESDILRLRDEITRAESLLGTKMTGGKYPGMVRSNVSDKIVEALGFKWWTLNEVVAHKRERRNFPTYGGPSGNLLMLPMNIFGNCFARTVATGGTIDQYLRLIKRSIRGFEAEAYIGYLYDERAPITIQEHLQNQRTDGRRQVPNIFDDLLSIEHIYALLRGADIWHTNCSDLAHYVDSYNKTTIVRSGGHGFTLEYNGNWDVSFLSLKCAVRKIRNSATGEILSGIYKGGGWIYNNIAEGSYETVESIESELVHRN